MNDSNATPNTGAPWTDDQKALALCQYAGLAAKAKQKEGLKLDAAVAYAAELYDIPPGDVMTGLWMNHMARLEGRGVWGAKPTTGPAVIYDPTGEFAASLQQLSAQS